MADFTFKLKANKFWRDGMCPKTYELKNDSRFELGKLYLLKLSTAKTFHFVVATITVKDWSEHIVPVGEDKIKWYFRDRHKHAYFPKQIESYAELGSVEKISAYCETRCKRKRSCACTDETIKI